MDEMYIIIGIISMSMFTVLMTITILSLHRRTENLEKELRRNKRMRKTASYEKGSDEVKIPEISSLDQEIIDLLDKGKKIEAIKKAREYYGFNLKEAKEYVERL